MLVKWIRSRTSKAVVSSVQTCIRCRASISGANDQELFFSGGVFLAGAGWFCGPACEEQYRLHFRIQPSKTPAAGTVRATPTPAPRNAATTATPARRPAADELAAALQAARKARPKI